MMEHSTVSNRSTEGHSDDQEHAQRSFFAVFIDWYCVGIRKCRVRLGAEPGTRRITGPLHDDKLKTQIRLLRGFLIITFRILWGNKVTSVVLPANCVKFYKTPNPLSQL